MNDYLLINKFTNKKGEESTKLEEYEGALIIKQYSGINTDNFIIKKFDGKKINFSFFKVNGIYYININGEHMIDYKRFVNIQQISNIEIDNKQAIKLKNLHIGDIIIYNCDTEIFQKALTVMDNYMKNKKTYFSEIVHFLFH